MHNSTQQEKGERMEPHGSDLLRTRMTITVDEAIEVLGLGRSTAYNAVRSGSLPAMKVKGRWLIPTAKLRKLLGLDDD
jgi:excisionase family DNA binding protein